MSSYNYTEKGHRGVYSPICPTNFSGTAGEWHLITTAWITIGATAIFFCLINLIIFLTWKPKQPLILFQISLTCCELCLCSGPVTSEVARIVDIQHISLLAFQISAANNYLFVGLYNMLLIYISLDRWVAIYFRPFYRNHVTSENASILTAITWFSFFAFYTPIFVIAKDYFNVSCNKSIVFAYTTPWFKIIQGISFPFTIGVIALSQTRLMFLAIRPKLRLHRNRKLLRPSVAVTTDGLEMLESRSTAEEKRIAELLEAKKLLRAMAKTVLAGSVVVIVAMLCQLPANILRYMGNQTSQFLYVESYVVLPGTYHIISHQPCL